MSTKYRVQVVIAAHVDVEAEDEHEAERIARDRFDDEAVIESETWTVLEECHE